MAPRTHAGTTAGTSNRLPKKDLQLQWLARKLRSGQGHHMVGADPQEMVRCAPLPDWVEHQPYESQTPEAGAPCMANGICRLLIDTQANLSGPEFAWHCRIAMRVL